MQIRFLFAAIAYWSSMAFAQAQYGGDPTRSYVDQMVRDRINLRRTEGRLASNKSKRQSPHSARSASSQIPQVKGLTYDAARKKIMAAGWQPRRQPSRYGQSDRIQGNGQTFWKKGYTEITDSSGTGRAFCRFEFQDRRGRILTVMTAGEDPNGKYHAVVDNVSVRQARKK